MILKITLLKQMPEKSRHVSYEYVFIAKQINCISVQFIQQIPYLCSWMKSMINGQQATTIAVYINRMAESLTVTNGQCLMAYVVYHHIS